jgi:hypothetical protein
VGNDSSFDLGGIGIAPRIDTAASRPRRRCRALEGRDPKRELVLLAHQPLSLVDAAPFGVGLQISGHTRRPDLAVWPPRSPAAEVLSGPARLGDAPIYVSRGTGYWGPPMRLAQPAEITQLTLESAAARMTGRAGRRRTTSSVISPSRAVGDRAAASVRRAANDTGRRARPPLGGDDRDSSAAVGCRGCRST